MCKKLALKCMPIITLRHERSAGFENVDKFKASSSAPAKTIKNCDQTGPHGEEKRPRISSAVEDSFIRVMDKFIRVPGLRHWQSIVPQIRARSI